MTVDQSCTVPSKLTFLLPGKLLHTLIEKELEDVYLENISEINF